MLRQPKFYQPTNLFLLPEARTPSHGGHMLERPRWMWADVEAMMREVRGELASTTVAGRLYDMRDERGNGCVCV